MNKKYLNRIIVIFTSLLTFFAPSKDSFKIANATNEPSNSISIGGLEKTSDGIYKTPVTLSGSLKSYSIAISGAGKFKLTSVSGTGYVFKEGNTGSQTDSTPSTGKDYVSVKLEVSAASDSLNSTSKSAIESIRYSGIMKNTTISINADTALLQSGDFYLNGHYYTLCSTNAKPWVDAMTWAYNLQSTDATRKYRYAGYISYPVIIESTTENNFVNTTISGGNKHIYLPAVPVTCNEGSITVSGTLGNKSITVVGQPKVSADISQIYGHGEYWKWLDKKENVVTNTATTSAGANVLPNESGTVNSTNNGNYWCYGNPTNGGMVYTAHPSVPGKWDDLSVDGTWSTNVWTAAITGQFANKMYGLAEWESNGDTTASATWNANEKTITYMNGSSVYNSETYIEGIGKETLISGPQNTETAEFIGWYDNESGGNKVTTISNEKTGDITLYARWIDYPTLAGKVGGFIYDKGIKKQFIAFGFTVSSNVYNSLENDSDFGIIAYKSGSNQVEHSNGTIALLKENEGRFYIYLVFDDTTNVTCYAKAFVKISGNYIYSKLVNETGNLNGLEYSL